MKNWQTICFVILSIIGYPLYSQMCPNINFTNGDFQNWGGTMTNYNATIEAQGTPPFPGGANVGDRFTIINAADATLDPWACDNLSTVPPNKDWAVKLGNELVGCKQDILEYTLDVTAQTNLLLYHYAIILEEPEFCPGGAGPHPPDKRPRFQVEISNTATGALIDPTCGAYEDYANPNIVGLRNCQYNGKCTYYRAWTTTGLDLTPYIGTQITLRFKTSDCGYCGHFGYAYVSAECQTMELDVAYCENNNYATITAPDGFSYLWDNGAFSQSIQITNPVIGAQVGVTLTNRQGCTSYITGTITSTNVTADFSVDQTEVCEGGTLSFSDLSSSSNMDNTPSTVTNWTWVIDSLDTLTVQNTSYMFPDEGTFNVTLTAEADNGCKESKTVPVTIHPIPKAIITSTNVCDGFPVTVNDSSQVSTGSIGQTNWDFGEPGSANNIAYTPQANHTYAQFGTYTISLEAISDQGCIHDTTTSVMVYQLPVANFKDSGYCMNKLSYFTDLTTFSSPIKNWLWDFGDQTPFSTLQDPNHIYSSNGDFDVSLLIIDSNNCSNQIMHTINIQDFQISYWADTACLYEQTSFNPTFNSPTDSISWVFGDGNISGLTNPIHTYPNSGSFLSTLYAVSDKNCIASANQTVYINALPTVGFIGDNLSGCVPLCVNFTNFSNAFDPISVYNWDFGDGNTSNAESPRYCYQDTGYFTVNLEVITDKGCSASHTEIDYVYGAPRPVALFTTSATELNILNTEVTFESQSLYTDSLYWNFFDSLIFSTPIVTFNFPGKTAEYLICLDAISNYGCEDSTCQVITVDGSLLYIPNSFTPDGNSINDVFIPVSEGLDPDTYRFFIFNRWGDLLFETHHMDEGWNGRFKDKLVQNDVYVWKIIANKIANDEQIVKIGHVSVLFSKTDDF